MGRLFKVEPALIGSAAATVFAAAAMLYHVLVAHDGPLNADVLALASGAVYGLYVRLKVTPLAQPKAKNHVRLVPVDQTPRHGTRM